MTDREPGETTNLDTLYGSATIPWSRSRDILAGAEPHGAARRRF